jgi:hypothetical protein
MGPGRSLGADVVLVDSHFDLCVAEVCGKELLGPRRAGSFWSATMSLDIDSGNRGALTQAWLAAAVAIANKDV